MDKIGRLGHIGKIVATDSAYTSKTPKFARKHAFLRPRQLDSRYMPSTALLRSGQRGLLAMVAAFLGSAGLSPAQEYEPRVARVQMQLKFGDDLVDVIEPGELLTIVGEQEKAYVILTHPGRRGLVEKVNALKLSEAVEIYDGLIKLNPKEGRLYTQRAAAWWARGDRQRALADFDQAIQFGYVESHAFTSRGMFHTAAG